MRVFNVDNLPPQKSYMRDTQLSKLTFAMTPDFSLYQIIPVGEDEVVLISTTLRPEMHMGGVASVKDLRKEFSQGYLALSFDSSKIDTEELSFMAKSSYMDTIRDRA